MQQLDNSQFVPMQEAVSTAMSTMAGVTANDELLFRQWLCTIILPDLGLSEEDVKVVQLYPTSLTVVKPADLKCIIDIELYNSNGNYLKHKYNAGVLRIIPDRRVIPTATTSSNNFPNNLIPVDVSSNAYSLYFGTNGEQVAYVVLRYWAYPTDENGWPLIRMEEMKACVLGLRYWWDLKWEKNRNIVDDSERRYKIEADRIRASKKALAFNNENMKKIAKQVWMRSIPDLNNLTGF